MKNSRARVANIPVPVFPNGLTSRALATCGCCHERQQRHVPRALDRYRQLALGFRIGAQAAARHDLALLKLEDCGWLAHLGFAFNQNRELKAGNIYNGTPTAYAAGTNGIGTLYKSMQFLYLGRKISTGNASFLFLKDDFNKYHM